MSADLTFAEVSRTNRTRCERWHPGFPNDGWTGADWSNAMAGEAGETCNVVKKLRRIEMATGSAAQSAGSDNHESLLAKLAMEIGDTLMYLDLLAQHYGLDLADCVVATFNRVSVREGFPERLPVVTSGLNSCVDCDDDIWHDEKAFPDERGEDLRCLVCHAKRGGGAA